jgi:hypothetical protein
VKPAEYFVVVTMREKRACKDCEEQGVDCAPVPVRIIEKGLASDRNLSAPELTDPRLPGFGAPGLGLGWN